MTSGCLGPLAQMLARGPEAVARSMGESVAYNAAGELARSDIAGGVAETADTVANLDSILQDHPDAVNAGELESLKREIAEDLPAPGDEAQVGTEVSDEMLADEAEVPWADPPTDPFDRRATPRGDSESRVGDQWQVTDDIGAPEFAAKVDSPLQIEQRNSPDQRMRNRDPFRFTKPKLTSMHEEAAKPTMRSLTGDNSFDEGMDGLRWAPKPRLKDP
ncbi:MAG: hypothetical protein PF961_21835 [Planctomycetota bacterium]|nr:hypothetical protein [Planctomycetota bacterium]